MGNVAKKKEKEKRDYNSNFSEVVLGNRCNNYACKSFGIVPGTFA